MKINQLVSKHKVKLYIELLDQSYGIDATKGNLMEQDGV